MRLPLSTLPTFRVVARLENLRAAADELHITHSAVCQQIRQLEERIGVSLFERRGRRIALNAAGRAFQPTVNQALDLVDDGVRAALAAGVGAATSIRVTALSSFAQRWLLPRLVRWHERHPDIGLELNTSHQVMDLKREGFHAAIRQGGGRWRGLDATPLLSSPLVAIGSPRVALRVGTGGAAAIAHQPLLGNTAMWERWFALAGVRTKIVPVAEFSDAGLMLQAAEQGMGIALTREVLAADALRDGKLVRLAPESIPDPMSHGYWLVHPPELAQWPPLVALHAWLSDEVAASERELRGKVTPPSKAKPKARRKEAALPR